MIRVVRTPEGAVLVDQTGKRSGRGAYLCPNQSCWDRAFRAGSLARALKAQIADADLAELRNLAATFSNDTQAAGATEAQP